jgi:hypothetical protein
MNRALQLTLLDTKELLRKTAVIAVHLSFFAIWLSKHILGMVLGLILYILDLQLQLFRAIIG